GASADVLFDFIIDYLLTHPTITVLDKVLVRCVSRCFIRLHHRLSTDAPYNYSPGHNWLRKNSQRKVRHQHLTGQTVVI
ncbi:hypothetical protein, partial [Microcoleus sp. N9_A4]|uniref:hypothetical protein n=1 Tax=Microcoleus sp. N9_A4 TaxID=3055383 RepID=UPI002FD07504